MSKFRTEVITCLIMPLNIANSFVSNVLFKNIPVTCHRLMQGCCCQKNQIKSAGLSGI